LSVHIEEPFVAAVVAQEVPEGPTFAVEGVLEASFAGGEAMLELPEQVGRLRRSERARDVQ